MDVTTRLWMEDWKRIWAAVIDDDMAILCSELARHSARLTAAYPKADEEYEYERIKALVIRDGENAREYLDRINNALKS